MVQEVVKTDLYKLVCSEHEEHWRHQFYLCLDHKTLLSAPYYQGTDMTPFSSENIDPKSALVIINFKQWDSELEDPLDEVDKDQLIKDGYTLNGERGLRGYISILEEERKTKRNTP